MIELVARDSGPFIVYVDDTEISRHNTERKAADKAVETAINLAFDNPDANVRYERYYVVDVTINAIDITMRVGAGNVLTPIYENEILVAAAGIYTHTEGGTTTTTPNLQPDQFTFFDQSNVSLSTQIESNIITLTGITPGFPSPLSWSGDASTEYRVNGGVYISGFTSVYNGDTIQVRHDSSANYSQKVNTTLTIGGVSDTFTSTTQAQPVAEIIFQDDFESYSIGQEVDNLSPPVGISGASWYPGNNNGPNNHPAGTNETVQLLPRSRPGSSSTKCLRFLYEDGGLNSWSEQRFDLGDWHSEVWTSYWIYYPDGTEGIPNIGEYYKLTTTNHKFFRLWGGKTTRRAPDPEDTVSKGGGSIFGNRGSEPGSDWVKHEWGTVGNSAHLPFIGTSGQLVYDDPLCYISFFEKGAYYPLVTDATRGTWQWFVWHHKIATGIGNGDGIRAFYVYDDQLNLRFQRVFDENSKFIGLGVDDLPESPQSYVDPPLNIGFSGGYLMGNTNTSAANFQNHTAVYIDEFLVTTTDPRP